VVAPYVDPERTSSLQTAALSGCRGLNGMRFGPDGKTLLPAPTGVFGFLWATPATCLATPNETYGVKLDGRGRWGAIPARTRSCMRPSM